MTTWDKLCVWAILLIDLFLKAIYRNPGDAPFFELLKLDLYFAAFIWMPVKALGWVFRRY